MEQSRGEVELPHLGLDFSRSTVLVEVGGDLHNCVDVLVLPLDDLTFVDRPAGPFFRWVALERATPRDDFVSLPDGQRVVIADHSEKSGDRGQLGWM